MPTPIASLSVDFTTNLAKLYDGLTQATQSVTKSCDAMKGAFSGIETAIGDVVKGVVDLRSTFAAIGASIGVGAFAELIRSSIKGETELYNLALQTGSTVEALSTMRSIARYSGTDLETVAKASRLLAKDMLAMQSGVVAAGHDMQEIGGPITNKLSQAFQLLGINTKSLLTEYKTTDQLMLVLAKRFAEFADGPTKVAIAQNLMKNSGAQIIPFLQTLAERGLDDVRVTTAQAKAAKELEDAWIHLGNQTRHFVLALTQDLLPAFKSVVDNLDTVKIYALAAIGVFVVWPTVVGYATASLAAYRVAAGWAALQTEVLGTTIGTTTILWRTFTATIGTSIVALFGTVSAALVSIPALIFTFFASWNIGKWLSDNIIDVKLFGNAMVEVFLIAWENIKYAAAGTWEILKAGFFGLINQLRTIFGGFVTGLGEGLSNFAATKDIGASLIAFGEAAKGSGSAIQDLDTALAVLGSDNNRAKKAIHDTIGEMNAYDIAVYLASQETKNANKNDLFVPPKAPAILRDTTVALQEYAKALTEAQKIRDTASASVATEGIKTQEADLERSYSRGLLAFHDYYDQRIALQTQAQAIEEALLTKNVKNQEVELDSAYTAYLALVAKGPSGFKTLEKYLEELGKAEAKLQKSEADLEDQQAKLNVSQQKGAQISKGYLEALIQANQGVLTGVKALNDQIEAAGRENDAIGLTKDQILLLNVARIEAIKLKEIDAGRATPAVIAALDAEIARTKQLANVVAQGIDKQKWVAAWSDLFKSAADAGAKFLEDFAQHGTKAFKNLWDDFKKWALEAIAKIAAQQIVLSVVANFAPSLSGIASNSLSGAGGPLGEILKQFLGGGGGGAGSIGKVVGDLGQTVSSTDKVFDEFGHSVTDLTATTEEAALNLHGFGETLAAAAATASSAAGGGSVAQTAGQAAGGLLNSSGGIAGLLSKGSTLYSVFGAAGSTFGAAAGAGMAAGAETLSIAFSAGAEAVGGFAAVAGAAAAFLPVAGVVIAAGLALKSYLDSKKGGPKVEGYSTTGEVPAQPRYDIGHDADAAISKQLAGVTEAYKVALARYGGTSAGVGFALGFNTDPRGKAPSNVHGTTFVGGKAVLDLPNANVGRSDAELQAEIQLQTQRLLLAALQNSNLKPALAHVLNSVVAASASEVDITSILGVADEVKLILESATASLSPAKAKAITDALSSVDFSGSANKLKTAFTTALDQLDPSLSKLVGGFSGTEDELKKFGNTIFSIYGTVDKISALKFPSLADETGAVQDSLNDLRDRVSGGLSTELGHITAQKAVDDLGKRLNTDLGRIAATGAIDDLRDRIQGGLGTELGHITAQSSIDDLRDRIAGGLQTELGHITAQDSISNLRVQLDEGLRSISAEDSIVDLRDRISTGLSTELGHVTAQDSIKELGNALNTELGHVTAQDSIQALGDRLGTALGRVTAQDSIVDLRQRIDAGLNTELGHVTAQDSIADLGNRLNTELGHITAQESIADLGDRLNTELGHVTATAAVDDLGNRLNTELSSVSAATAVDELRDRIGAGLNSITAQDSISDLRDRIGSGLNTELGHITAQDSINDLRDRISTGLSTELGHVTTQDSIGELGDRITAGLSTELDHVTAQDSIGELGDRIGTGLSAAVGDISATGAIDDLRDRLDSGLNTELSHVTATTAIDDLRDRLESGLSTELGHITAQDSIHALGDQVGGGLSTELGHITAQDSIRALGDRLKTGLSTELGHITAQDLTGYVPGAGLSTEQGHITAQTGVPPEVVSYRQAIDAVLDGTQETADKVLVFLQAILAFGDGINGVGADLHNLDPKYITALIDALGGADKAAAQFNYLFANFTTSADKSKKATSDLAASFAALGLAVPATHQGFLDLLNSIPKTTDAGRALYASILALAPAFIEVAGTADEAAKALQTAADFFAENFYTDAEKSAKSYTDALAVVDTAQKTLGVEIPHTAEGFRKLIEGIDRTTPAGDALYKALIVLAPEILVVSKGIDGLADAAQTAGAAIIAVATSLGDIGGSIDPTGADAAQRFMDQIKSLADSIPNATFGQKLTFRVHAIADELKELQAKMNALDPTDYAGREAYTLLIARLGYGNTLLTAELARFTILTAQYGDATAEQLVGLEEWYDDQKKLFNGNDAALKALADVFKQRWDAIIAGTSTGVDGAISELERLRKSIADYLKSLVLSDLSPLTPAQKLAEAQKQYQDALAKAAAGDPTALADITKFADAYLRQARDFYASSTAYTDIFKLITDELAALAGTTSTGQPIRVPPIIPGGQPGPTPAGGLTVNDALVRSLPLNGQKIVSSDDLNFAVKTLSKVIEEALGALANANTEDSKDVHEELKKMNAAILDVNGRALK